MQTKVGIIVPFYKGHIYLKELIESIDRAGRGLSCKVFIIDNSPENQPIKLPDPIAVAVEVVREKPGIGYGKACNKGFDLCRKEGLDYIIISNQDGYFSKDMIHNLLAPFEKDASIMVSAPMLKVYGSEEIEDFFIKYYLSQVPEMLSELLLGKVRDHYEMKAISGACFAFRINRVQYPHAYLFDPVFHMYFEDEDFCRRVRAGNNKIVLLPRGADFYHQHSHTTDVENKDKITSDKLLGEKLFRLKDPQRSIVKALYGIFVTTSREGIYHLLRGEGSLLLMQLRTSFMVLTKISRIRKTRKREAVATGF